MFFHSIYIVILHRKSSECTTTSLTPAPMKINLHVLPAALFLPTAYAAAGALPVRKAVVSGRVLFNGRPVNRAAIYLCDPGKSGKITKVHHDINLLTVEREILQELAKDYQRRGTLPVKAAVHRRKRLFYHRINKTHHSTDKVDKWTEKSSWS